MYKVFFNESLFGEVKVIEEAVSLSLAVHRSSNVKHEVKVLDVNSNLVLTFNGYSADK